jgi:hypothetical protein
MNVTSASNSSSSQFNGDISGLSEHDYPFDDHVTCIIFVVATLLVCLGMAGNAITVLIVVIKRLYSPTFVTIAWLALSDIMAAITRYTALLIYMFYNTISRRYVFGIFSFMFLHSANFHMVLLSYVRYKFIVKPLRSLAITCRKVIKLSAFIWMLSLIVSGAYAVKQFLALNGELSYYEIVNTEIGFGTYTVVLPFILVIYFHIRKNIHMCNAPKQNEGAVAKSTHVMSIVFSIIIMIYLISYVYPIIYSTGKLKFKYRHDLFDVFLLINNSINPLIYFAFSPPVLQMFSRSRNYFDEISSNPTSLTSIFGKRYDVQQESRKKPDDLDITDEDRICKVFE